MQSNQVIQQVNKVDDLWLLLTLRNVYRITSVTVRTRLTSSTRREEITLRSPYLKENSLHEWQLRAESCSFGSGTEVVGFSIQYSKSNNGGNIYEREFVRLNGSKLAGRVLSVIHNITISTAQQQKREVPQLFYNGQSHRLY